MNHEEQVKSNMRELTFYKGNSDKLGVRKNLNGDMEPSQTVRPVGS